MKNFTRDDYFRVVGVESGEQFQKLFDKKIDTNDENGDINYPILNDLTKLNFLPGEPRPNFILPPLAILPTDYEHKVIGAKPIFGGTPNSQMLEGDCQATMIAMEVDENLLNTSEQAVIVDTSVSDVVVEDHKETNYSARLRNLTTAREKALHIVQMLVKDALMVGRIEQSMLQNMEVMKIIQVLMVAITILISRQSMYFDNFNVHNLELINVETTVDASHGYYTLLQNGLYAGSLFEVSRNLFNFKMEAVTENQFQSAPEESPKIRVFKEFLYYILRENRIQNLDDVIVFRSERRF